MSNKWIDALLRHGRPMPAPERKTEFFRRAGEMGLLNRRSAVISHREFLGIQLFYLHKGNWIVSVLLLLFLVWICRRHSGNYPFALPPLLAAGILFEIGRSRRWNMTELEQAARFSARSVMMARLFLLGTGNTAGLMAVIFVVRPFFAYSLSRVFLYMMVPYLAAALLGSLYERRHRRDGGWGSVVICLLSSFFFAASSRFFSLLYEDRMIVLWASALLVMIGGLAVCIGRSVYEREVPAWN